MTTFKRTEATVLKRIAEQPASLLPVYDLVIASKKLYGITSDAAAPILWWKLAGQPKQEPPQRCALTDPAIQKKLLSYDLIDTETRQGMIIRRYRKSKKETI